MTLADGVRISLVSGAAGLLIVGLATGPVGATEDQAARRDDDDREVVLVAADDDGDDTGDDDGDSGDDRDGDTRRRDDDTDGRPDDTDDGRADDTNDPTGEDGPTNSNDGTNSKATQVSRNRDRSAAGLTRDLTNDGPGKMTRDLSDNRTNDASVADTRASKPSNDNTNSKYSKVSKDKDRSHGDRTRDFTKDGGDRTRDNSRNQTNDKSRNDTR